MAFVSDFRKSKIAWIVGLQDKLIASFIVFSYKHFSDLSFTR